MIDWKAPAEPGVYIFRSAKGEVLYVGKAKSLSARLSHYRHPAGQLPKTAAMLSKADSLEVIACRNESEALVLENTLIKQHRPAYNITLKDSVYYAYLKITGEQFPRILTVRRRDAGKGERVIGPFVSGTGRSVALREIRRAFGIRICEKLPKQACLQYHLGFCTAPCIGKISEEKYGENVEKAEAVLRGKTGEVEKSIEKEMGEASGRLDYERALQLRERLSAIQRIKQRQLMEVQSGNANEDFFGFVHDGEVLRCCVLNSRQGIILNRDSFVVEAIAESPEAEMLLRYYESHQVPSKIYAVLQDEGDVKAINQVLSHQGGELIVPQRGDKLELSRLAEKNAGLAAGIAASSHSSVSLQKALGLNKPPASIDCFDVSNFGGKQNVGSCVRLLDGKPDKGNYRRFLVRGVQGQDDFASMKEIVYRRYAGAIRGQQPLPDLVLIDGGPGQLHAAASALAELGEPAYEVSIAALAKREEEIYLPDVLSPLKLPKSHAGLQLLMRARDEAHRFALKYNRKRRKMESVY